MKPVPRRDKRHEALCAEADRERLRKQSGIIHKGQNGKYADPATVACRAVLRTLPY